MLRHAEWQRVTDVLVGAIFRVKNIFFCRFIAKGFNFIKKAAYLVHGIETTQKFGIVL